MPSGETLADRIRSRAAEAGYSACGFTGAEPFVEFAAALADRSRRFPAAAPLYEHLRHRVDPRATKPWVRTIVVCVRWYGRYELPASLLGHIGRNYLADQRWYGCPEYEMPRRFGAALRALGLRVARGGVPDRWAAARAGVARVGRNCFAYSEHGSWINLATWRVDAEIPPDRPTLDCPCPAGCQACLEACPTGALVEPFVMRQDRCIAHLTYGPEWPVPPELWTRMGAWVYGCDVCQEVCPLNRGTWRNAQRADWLDPVAAILTPEALADMDEATYRSVVHPRFWYIPEDGLARWRANAQRAVAAARGNAGAPQLCSNDAWTARACLPACRQVLAGRPSND